MEERRESAQGRRQDDRRLPLRPATALLILILLLQGALLVLHFRSKPPLSQPSSPEVRSGEADAAADALLKLQLVSAEPEVQRLVGRLKQGLAGEAQAQSFGVAVENIRVESATGIGEVVVSARLRNDAPIPVAKLRCRLQLRDNAGVLLYQATGEPVGLGPGEWLPGELLPIRFLVDNPPAEFTQATLALDRLDFAVNGYKQRR